jgi:hypothetical protein
MFPVTGAEFIKENDLKGNIYNPVHWGGYLIWKLFPGKKVFTDGRNLNFPLYRDYLAVDNAEPVAIAGMPARKAMLEAYNINYVLTPFSKYGGGLVPLIYALFDDRIGYRFLRIFIP